MMSKAATALTLLTISFLIVACAGDADPNIPGEPQFTGPLGRTTENRPDADGPEIQIVYALPADGVDRHLDTDGTLSASVDALNRWLLSETGNDVLNFDEYRGQYDILFFQSAKTDAAISSLGAYVRDSLEAEMADRDLIEEDKLYAVYYDGSSTYACGGGAWPPVLEGAVAAAYLKGNVPGVYNCADNEFGPSIDEPGDWDYLMLHEILHTLGFIAECAPNEQDQGHTQQSHFDLMYNGSEEEGEPRRLDVGRDDYYGHDNEDCPDFQDSEFLVPGLPATG